VLAAFVVRAASPAQAGKPSPFHEQVNEEVPVARRKLLRQLVFSFLLIVLAGCGGSAGSSAATTESFPVTLTTAKGKVTIPHKPTHVVSLSGTATEDLFAVGAGSQVVAVDSYSTYPAEAPRTNLSGFTPNIEAIGSYQPDLVIVSDDTNGIVGQLAKLQVPALVEPPAADLQGVYAQINQIAQATGHSAQAASVVSGIQQKVQSILGSVTRPDKVAVSVCARQRVAVSTAQDTTTTMRFVMLFSLAQRPTCEGRNVYQKSLATDFCRSNTDKPKTHP